MMFLGNVVIPSTAIVSREVVQEVGFFDESLTVAEDTEYFHRVAAHAPGTVLMKPLSEYRIGHPSLVSQKSEHLIVNAILSGERAALLRLNHSDRERAAIREGSRMLRVRLAFWRLAELDRKGAREALRESSRRYVVSARSVAIILASLLPLAVLRGLHWAKRAMRGRRR
jgi:hypothetical protein